MELKILFGPTATSKTKIAQSLWEKYHYPILSVDSRKVYKGADIGTNKLSLLTFRRAHPEVLVGGIDFLEPNEEISAYLYQQHVYAWLSEHQEEIKEAGGIILHGGTGLYLDAILEGKSLLSAKDTVLRDQLSLLSVEQLQEKAEVVASARYKLLNESDRMNPRRLVRVIENAKQETDKMKASNKIKLDVEWFCRATRDWMIHIPPRAELYEIINKRVYTYLKEGWLAEVAELLRSFGPYASALRMMGYRQVVNFMQVNEDWQQQVMENSPQFQEMIADIQREHRRYAKRQETWARKYR